MIFKITTDEDNPRICSILTGGECTSGKDFYFSVVAFYGAFYYLDASCIYGEPLTLKLWESEDGWMLEDTQNVFRPAYNVKVEVVDSFPIPT